MSHVLIVSFHDAAEKVHNIISILQRGKSETWRDL